MTYIWIRNLPFETTAQELTQIFSHYGSVAEVKVSKDRLGESKGEAHVLMPNEEGAQRAVAELNRSTLGKNTIMVQQLNQSPFHYSPQFPQTR